DSIDCNFRFVRICLLPIENQKSKIKNQTMANEELIYRITRAVYGRLGAETDERVVEQLVTDVYRAIEPVVENGRGARSVEASQQSEREREAREAGSADRLIISVFGVDHPGIVAGVSQVLAEAECSNMSRAGESAAALKERFRREGERLGVRIYAQREDLFNAMHRI
ncbi:MAG: hypothetical protein M3362_24600, partial [Acidobacteriota bacterium]|nr:hypothetical protein [Acidobacteriota bacterium]